MSEKVKWIPCEELNPCLYCDDRMSLEVKNIYEEIFEYRPACKCGVRGRMAYEKEEAIDFHNKVIVAKACTKRSFHIDDCPMCNSNVDLLSNGKDAPNRYRLECDNEDCDHCIQVTGTVEEAVNFHNSIAKVSVCVKCGTYRTSVQEASSKKIKDNYIGKMLVCECGHEGGMGYTPSHVVHLWNVENKPSKGTKE